MLKRTCATTTRDSGKKKYGGARESWTKLTIAGKAAANSTTAITIVITAIDENIDWWLSRDSKMFLRSPTFQAFRAYRSLQHSDRILFSISVFCFLILASERVTGADATFFLRVFHFGHDICWPLPWLCFLRCRYGKSPPCTLTRGRLM